MAASHSLVRYLGIAVALAAIGANAITPEQFSTAPRRDTGLPNPSGEIALVSTSRYSFERQSTSAERQLLDLKTGNLTGAGLNAREVNEVVWLPGTETGIIYINGTNENVPGGVTLWIGDIKNPSARLVLVAKTRSGSLNFLVNALAYANGSAYNAELESKPRHSGRLYENIYPRHWVQSNERGRKFKALVTHDDLSQVPGFYSTDELWFLNHDFNGTMYDEGTTYEKFNPFAHIANWSTPHFVVHNTLDYRLPESDGLGLFNVLQSKGIPSRFLNFPDEDHQLTEAENLLFWHPEIFNWINHWSKGEPLDGLPIGG